ncbi:MAG: efflux RND transporter permease subunit [bacterium]|nr:efflux RND transporter permease subunit [bacterium]
MFLSRASVRRPVAMCSLIIALALLGINAYRKMGLENLPKVDAPYITVMTIYPGASPEEIETDIAKRIEDVIVSIDGLKHVTSSCMENGCQTFLEFDLDIAVEDAANDVREKLDLIVNEFPAGAEKPKVLKWDINAKPIVNLALTGDAPLDELYDYADNALKDRITVVPGVAEVQLIGGAEREVQILLDRDKLAARGLSSYDVVQAVQSGVRLIPSGRLRDDGTEYVVKYDADYKTVAAIHDMEIAHEDTSRCYVGGVGRVEMTTEELRQKAFIDGRPCVGIKIVKRGDANAVRVVRRVQEAMADLRDNLPGGMDLVWVADDASFIQSTVDSTMTNIWQGVLLTAVILFFFLYNIRTTFIIAVTMPLTIIVGMFFLGLLDYTLNVSTLLSIGLSIGILVTNSIVVLESIVKRFDETGDAHQASRLGASEVAVAVLASAGTNVVVLFPVAMMGSQIGLFFRPFALTMVVMTVVSLFISFTMTPILCSLLLKKDNSSRRSPLKMLERVWNRAFDSVAGAFAAVLRFFERRRWAAALLLILVTGVFFYSLTLAETVGFDFFPNSDRGEVFVKLEYPTRYDLNRTARRVEEVEALLHDLPELKHVFTTIGKVDGTAGRSSEGVYLAQLLLRFSEKTERTLTIDDLMNEVRLRIADHLDCIVTVSQPSNVGGQSTPIELEIAGEDLAELDALALKAQQFALSIEGCQEPDTTVRSGKPELRVRPQRAVLADLGIPPALIGMALRANLEGLECGTFKEGGRNYDIVVKMDEEEGKDQVRDFLFPGTPGHPVLLTSIAEVDESRAPIMITRKNKRRVAKLFCGLANDKPMGTAANEISALMDEQGNLPSGYAYRFSGLYELMHEGIVEMGEAALIAIVLVYLVLAAILESFKQPIVILITIPLGLVGVLVALWLTGRAISMFVLLGGVMLVGIVVNNAILIMDQLNQHVAAGIPRHQAMVRAASERFRPIIMISLAAVLGMLPLALGSGIGSELRTAIGISSVGGIAVSAVLTLIVLPVLYDLFTRRQKVEPGNTGGEA